MRLDELRRMRELAGICEAPRRDGPQYSATSDGRTGFTGYGINLADGGWFDDSQILLPPETVRRVNKPAVFTDEETGQRHQVAYYYVGGDNETFITDQQATELGFNPPQ